MSFRFRRKDKMPFKHIAHGLVPAATIAPRPAVPRTPPPRSPNPSPERPRSALSAIILTSCLTGRTVAIPQPNLAWPRPRSNSESDSARSEQRSLVEPYASVTELGLRNEWQGTVKGRPQFPLPSDSDEEYDDEEEDQDLEQQSSDKDQHFYYVLEKDQEAPKQEPVYAVPHKEKKEEIPVSVSSEMTEISSCDVVSAILLDEPEHGHVTEKPPVQTCKVQKEKVGKVHSSPENSPITDVNDNASVETPRTSSALTQKKIKARKKVNTAESKSDELAELLSLRQHAQQLVDENDAMKVTIHRLNVELSHYQAKYRPLLKEEGSHRHSLPVTGPPPPWLVDMKYLSPLLLAYEDQLRERDDVIKAQENEMKNFRARVEEIVCENNQLHQQLERSGAVSSREWRQLQDQAKLVLEENQVLMEQLEVQQAKAKDSHNRHLQEASNFTKQLVLLEAEKQSQQEELLETQQQLKHLRSKYEQLRADLDNKMGVDEHSAMVNELKRQLHLEQEKQHVEVEELMGRIASLQAEKKSLLLEKTELTADNKTLEAEMEEAKKSNRISQKKIGLLKQQTEEAMEKEVAAHQYLANLISLAEKTTYERDQLVYVTRSLENEKHGVLNKIMAGNVRLGKLEEKVKLYKTKATVKLGDINNRMKEQEEDFSRKTAQYQQEICHLQRLLKDKQETLDGVLEQKRQVETELETVWESTTRENRHIKDLLRGTLNKNSLLAPAHFYGSGIDENPHRYASSHSNFRAFSYCDVTVSSPRRLEDGTPHGDYVPSNNDVPLPHRVAESGDCTATQRKQKSREGIVMSPMFESDSDQQQNASSDESEKNDHDFYS
ncbi:centrosomal protein of 89 kDa isoform X2 [Callorhinchus milii]|uniref:centrosomal protein of 89 kDa isoform X2 n=1 Tax=Callorhinchus milii TaxID=7868 RepID=UPI001C3F58BA|nr:centrosomal protein of 89 kDa isoform X2 [Callorhinchus milii]